MQSKLTLQMTKCFLHNFESLTFTKLYVRIILVKCSEDTVFHECHMLSLDGLLQRHLNCLHNMVD